MTEDATEFAPIPQSRPLTDPLAAKDQLVAGWTRIKGQHGIPTDAADIERLAVHDLNIAAAVLRDDGPSQPAPPESVEDRTTRQAAFDAEQAAKGALVTRAPAPKPTLIPDLELSMPPSEFGPSWPFAKGRILRIMQGATPTFTADGVVDWSATLATCNDPKRAREFTHLKAWYDFRLTPQTWKHNPFAHMSSLDAGRKFIAETVKICDRSTGKLGAWWTK